MTFLDLVKRLRQEAGVSGTGPTTVTGQTGEMGRLVNWIGSAWTDIQLQHPTWNWMVGEASFTLTPGQAKYSPAQCGISSRFGRWNVDSFRLGVSAGDESELGFVNYPLFRSAYLTGASVSGRPSCISTYPDMGIGFGVTPDNAYAVRGEYWKAPQALSADADVPEMPEQFHEAIVYRALMLYARYESAAEIYDDANMNYRRYMTLIQNHQLPDVGYAEAMA